MKSYGFDQCSIICFVNIMGNITENHHKIIWDTNAKQYFHIMKMKLNIIWKNDKRMLLIWLLVTYIQFHFQGRLKGL